jgi:hypothetical protein
MLTRRVRAATSAVTAIASLVSAAAHGGLLVQYKFDGDTLDSSGNGHHATFHGGSYVAGETDGAIHFNNPSGAAVATQYVTIPNAAEILDLGDASFSFAIKYRSTDTALQNGRLFGVNSGSTYLVYNYNAGGTAQSHGSFGGTEGTFNYGNRDTPNPLAITTDGDWHWAVVVLNRDTSTVSYYVDANVISSASYAALGEVPFANLTIGRFNGDGTDSSTSYGARLTSVDEFRLYDHALSAAEVSAIPEPSALVGALLMGTAGLLAVRRHGRSAGSTR